MKKILVVYYSQSGDVGRALKSFTKYLDTPDVEITWECIKPKACYPYPWKLYNFFDVFPECINEEFPEIYPPNFSRVDKFDLVIVAYQVWFLSPSLPIQSFLNSKYAKVLQGTKVITLIVCRNMWHSASKTMKRLIQNVSGIHIDNVVVTHQGAPLATFITTPRLLLTGKKDRLLGALPPGGLKEEDIDALSRFGQKIANNLAILSDDSNNQSFFTGMNPVKVNTRYIIPEIVGHFVYRPWAKIARFFGKQGSWTRKPVIYLFALHTVLVIPIVLLSSTLFQVLFSHVISKKIKNYAANLQHPSGIA